MPLIGAAGALHAEAVLMPASPTAAATRMFYGHLQREGAVAADAMTAIVRPLVARAKQGRKPRAELIAGASAAWAKTVPEAGRIRPVVIRKCLSQGKLSLVISDTAFLNGVGVPPRRRRELRSCISWSMSS